MIGILHFQAVAGKFLLAKPDLKESVTCCDARLNVLFHVFHHVLYLLLSCVESREVVFQDGNLPIVLSNALENLLFCKLALENENILLDACQLVACRDLSASIEGLDC